MEKPIETIVVKMASSLANALMGIYDINEGIVFDNLTNAIHHVIDEYHTNPKIDIDNTITLIECNLPENLEFQVTFYKLETTIFGNKISTIQKVEEEAYRVMNNRRKDRLNNNRLPQDTTKQITDIDSCIPFTEHSHLIDIETPNNSILDNIENYNY